MRMKRSLGRFEGGVGLMARVIYNIGNKVYFLIREEFVWVKYMFKSDISNMVE